MSGARHCVPEPLERGERRRATCATASAPLTAATAEVPPLSPPLPSPPRRALGRDRRRADRAGRAVGECDPVEGDCRQLQRALLEPCSRWATAVSNRRAKFGWNCAARSSASPSRASSTSFRTRSSRGRPSGRPINPRRDSSGSVSARC